MKAGSAVYALRRCFVRLRILLIPCLVTVIAETAQGGTPNSFDIQINMKSRWISDISLGVHFRNHGIKEFGIQTPEQYLDLARMFGILGLSGQFRMRAQTWRRPGSQSVIRFTLLEKETNTIGVYSQLSSQEEARIITLYRSNVLAPAKLARAGSELNVGVPIEKFIQRWRLTLHSGWRNHLQPRRVEAVQFDRPYGPGGSEATGRHWLNQEPVVLRDLEFANRNTQKFGRELYPRSISDRELVYLLRRHNYTVSALKWMLDRGRADTLPVPIRLLIK